MCAGLCAEAGIATASALKMRRARRDLRERREEVIGGDQSTFPERRMLLLQELLDDAALTVGDELGKVGDVLPCAFCDGLADGFKGLGGIELRGLQQPI